jgi:protocatechuate 3,4-dioxygenase beta subunit
MTHRETRRSRKLLSRRDTLKVCLLPAGVMGARLLGGCSTDPMGGVATPPGGVLPGSMGAGVMPAGGKGSAMSGRVGSGGAPGMNTSPQVSGMAGRGASAGAPISMPPPAIATAGAGGGAIVTAGSGAGGAMGGGGMGSVAVPMGWATGGTKAMQGMYPDPFAMGVGDMCRLYPRQTLGPCYANGPMMRRDISDEQPGLPMRLSFLVVRSDCSPVPNATVDIWHSGREGTYSALNSPICNPTSMSTVAETFCRGVQATNEAGVAEFDSIFPGWYFIRTIHIHFTVRIDGAEVTSQLYFDDELTDEILGQGGYETRGPRPVRNGTDMEFRTGGATPEQVTFETAKRADGALHAWKVLSIS